MIVKKTLTLRSMYKFAGHHLSWLFAWMAFVSALYYFTGWTFSIVPWQPLSLIGTAVALYVGFKNNQSYDRLWEARIIWGAITNSSRKLATMIKHFHSDDSAIDSFQAIRKQIVFRHIAWIYQLREQLLEPTQWEHVSLEKPWKIGYYNRLRRDEILTNFKADLEEVAGATYISREERDGLSSFNNKATQLLDKQTELVQFLYENKSINPIQQVELQNVLNVFYDEQGKSERIKRFPLPRKYASFSFVFVCIFVFLLPFGIVSEFSRIDGALVWLTIPIGVIVGWIYVVMEMIGDYSENPFEGLHNDIPMLAICRNIEIDMLQMIGESKIPKPIQPKANVLF